MKTAKEIYIYIFAALFVLGFFALAIYFRNTPDNTQNAGIIETVKNGVILILGYLYGSSKGSADKTEIMNKEINEPK
jgi:hypothetical protein